MKNRLLHTKALITKENISATDGVIENIIGSTAVVDRMGDIIDQGGWKLANFKDNPVILYGHNSRDILPIGRAIKVWVEGKGTKNAKLMFNVKFDLQDDFAAKVYRKIKEGFLNTVSVGFQPLEWIELDPDNWFGGLKFLEQDLLELSVVPIPANPQAVIPMKSFAEQDKRFAPMSEKDVFPFAEDNRFKKMMTESKEVTAEKVKEVKESEYVVELRSAEDFDQESFRALAMKKNDKEYVVIVGKLVDSEAYVEQSHRFAKDAWTEEEIKAEEAENETETEVTEEKAADDEEDTTTDDSKFDGVTASQLREMMDEVWEDGYEAGEEDKGMAVPADDTKVKDMKVGEAKALMDQCFKSKKPKKEDDDKDSAVEEVKAVAEEITKAGRVLSAKNETKVRQAVDLLASVLSALDKQDAEETEEEPEKSATENVFEHKEFALHAESEAFDTAREVAKANTEDLKLMSVYQEVTDNADDKSAFKMIHHTGDKEHKTVFRAVASAMGALLGAKGANVPEAVRKAAYDHLAKHYEEFGKQAPDYALVEKQVLAGLDDEVHALILDREEKHVVRLLKKVLSNQKETKKETTVNVEVDSEKSAKQLEAALQIINLALDKSGHLKKGETKVV